MHACVNWHMLMPISQFVPLPLQTPLGPDFHSLNLSLFLSQKQVIKMKRQPSEWHRIFANKATKDKPPKYTDSSWSSGSKKQTTQSKNGVGGDLNRHFSLLSSYKYLLNFLFLNLLEMGDFQIFFKPSPSFPRVLFSEFPYHFISHWLYSQGKSLVF